ncbi:MAG: hypothetical protein KJ058_04685 [Thermoanaerobaculia bacterium]|nr:hypothetical protein [Thermoanaerobaculia bacterium]
MRTLGGRGLATATAGLLLLLLLAGAAPGAEPPLTLRILWDRPLPEAVAKASDLRWASDESLYLALGAAGVVEMSLAPFGERIETIVPGKGAPGGFSFAAHLAAHGEEILAGSFLSVLTWRTRKEPVRREAAVFDIIEDLDLHRGKVAILSARRDADGKFAPEGGIAWIGSLATGMEDARPVVFDSRGRGAPNLVACGTYGLGAARFLADRSFVVVPGVQPGAHHFDPEGRLLRTWDTVALGLTDDCPRLAEQEARRIHFPPERWAWLDARRTLDELVPLPQGIGLVVRSVVDGRQQWELIVLALDGSVAGRLLLPISPVNEITHLKADLRGRRLALLVMAHSPDITRSPQPPGRLLMAELGDQPDARQVRTGAKEERDERRAKD